MILIIDNNKKKISFLFFSTFVSPSFPSLSSVFMSYQRGLPSEDKGFDQQNGVEEEEAGTEVTAVGIFSDLTQ